MYKLVEMYKNRITLKTCIGTKYTYIHTAASKKFWSSMSFQNLVRLSQIKNFSLPDYAHVNNVSKN
jgi:hypothetical protein